MLLRKYILLLLVSTQAQAFLVRNNFEGTRPVGMGNAFIAISDDSNVLFYNPAGLTKIKKGVHFHIFDFNLGVDNTNTLSRIANALFKGDSNNLIRQDTEFLKFGVRPSVFTRFFGFQLYNNTQGFFDLKNLESLDSKIDVFAVNDLGIAAGFGIPFGDYFSLGFSLRGVQRSAIDARFQTLDLVLQSGATSLDGLKNAVYSHIRSLMGLGWGVGLNVGALLELPVFAGKGAPTWKLAGTIEDLGNTTYKKLGNNTVPPVSKAVYNFGTALNYPLSKDSEANLALDVRHCFEPLPFIQTLHFGGEYRHKNYGLRVGLYQGYPTAGISIETPPHTRIHFSTYAVELGRSAWERQQRWWLMQVIIGFNPL